jgi:hypothetical protein
VAVQQRQQPPASIPAVAVSVAFGELQVLLLRRLAAQLRCAGAPAGQTLRLQASTDQLEASVREGRNLMQGISRPW